MLKYLSIVPSLISLHQPNELRVNTQTCDLSAHCLLRETTESVNVNKSFNRSVQLSIFCPRRLVHSLPTQANEPSAISICQARDPQPAIQIRHQYGRISDSFFSPAHDLRAIQVLLVLHIPLMHFALHTSW